MRKRNGQYDLFIVRLKKVRRMFAEQGTLRGYLVRGVVGNGSLHISSMFLGMISSIVLARILGAEGFGAFSFAMAFVALIAIPVQFGFPQYVVKCCAIYQHRAHYSFMKGLLRTALVFVFTAATIVAIVAALIIGWIGARQTVMAETLFWALALIPWAGVCAINSSALRGIGAVTLGQLAEQVIRPSLFLSGVCFCLFIGWTVDAVRAVQFNVAATMVAAIVTFVMLARIQPAAYALEPAKFAFKEWLFGAVPFLALSGTLVLIQQVDIIMLGILASAHDVGIYTVVSRLGALVAVGLVVIGPVIAPQLARLHDAEDWQSMQRVLSYTARVALLIASPIIVLLLLCGGWLLGAIYGDTFAEGQLALMIIVVGQLVNVSMGTVGQILNMTGRAWYTVAGVSVAICVNILLNLLLIPPYGIEGAAISTMIATCVWNVLLAFWVYKHTGLVTTAIYWRPSRV